MNNTNKYTKNFTHKKVNARETEKNTLNECLRASPVGLNMWPCRVKLDEEKWKHANLAQENGFVSG